MKTVLSVMMGMALAGSVLAQEAGKCPANPMEYPPFTGTISIGMEELLDVFGDAGYGVLRVADGKLVLPMVYEQVMVCEEGIVAQEAKSGLFGLFDLDGRELIAPRYANLMCPDQGIIVFTDTQGLQGVVNTAGKVVVEPRYQDMFAIFEGMIGVEQDGRWGFINVEGKEVVAPQFDEVGIFSGGFASVKQDDKYGLVDAHGKLVVAMQYDELEMADGGEWVLARQGERAMVLNTKGEVLFAMDGRLLRYFPEEKLFLLRRKDDKTSYVDMSGKEVLAFAYDDVQGFYEGLAAVRVGEKWGYFNAQGEMVITPQFASNDVDLSGDFMGGAALVFVDGKGFLIDHSGKAISKPYAQISETEIGSVMIMDGERVGLLGRDGREMLAPVYQEIVPSLVHKDRFLAKNTDGIWQLHDDQGCVLASQAGK